MLQRVVVLLISLGVLLRAPDRAESDALLASLASDTTVRSGWLFTVMIAAASFGAGFVFDRMVGRRAQMVRAAAAAIADGRLDARSGLDGADAISVIGRAVDTMGERLSERAREKAEGELRFRAVFEQGDPTFVAGPDGRFIEANRAALKLTGYTIEELQRLHITDLQPPEERTAFRERVQVLVEVGCVAAVRTVITKAGERVPLEMSLHHVGGGCFIAVGRDLRPRLQAEELRSRMAMQERLASLGRLAASVGHEINNPLSFVMGNLTAILESVRTLPPAHRGELVALVSDAREGADRVRRIVSDLRIFARKHADDVLVRTDLAAVVQSTANLAGPAIRERARLVVDLPADLPPIRSDERRLAQVLLNLFNNAADAIPAHREGTVRVVAARDRDRILLDVIDDGVGIPPAHLPRIFDPFYTTKPPGEGTGLGLAIARELLERTGADIEVTSEVGVGSRFRLRLPILVEEDVGVAAAPPSRPPPPEAPAAAPTETLDILVIDDEPLFARVLTRALRGHRVTVASGHREALDACVGRTFDVIFCDLSMPDGGGPAFWAGLTTTRPDLAPAVVFMTGGAATPEASEFLQRTERPVLEKPFESREIRAIFALRRAASASRPT